jgi:KipI family sensor histidine kinase inhibitor
MPTDHPIRQAMDNRQMTQTQKAESLNPVWRLAADTGLLLDFNGWGPVLRPEDYRQPDPQIARIARLRADQIRGRMQAGELAGLIDIVPGLTSILLHYDPLATSAARLRDAISLMLAEPLDQQETAPRKWLIPALYNGPDLSFVASQTGLSEADIITRHANKSYEIAVMGFLPGLGYMTGLDPALSLPRRAEPRTHVPARSLAIAMGQSVIYPMDSPGGWHLIGIIPFDVFTTQSDEPILFRPGDLVCFEAVSQPEFARLEKQAAAGQLPARLIPADEAGHG